MVVTLVAACGGDSSDAPAMDEAAATMEATGPSMADLTGTWNLMAMVDGTPDPISVVVEFAADGSAMMTLPDRDPMAMTVTISGDSIVMQGPEYESVIREGVTVSTRTAAVVDGDMMMGSLTATYQSDEGTEIVGGTMEGTRGGM
jgi:hypothetical protein